MERDAEGLSLKIRSGESALSQKLSAIQGEEKKKVKALEAEKTAELMRHIGGLAQVTSVDKTIEKQHRSTTATEIKVECKKLEKLAKEVATHADKRRAAEEELELKVGTLEKKTADKIAGWRAAHNAAMEKLKGVSDSLDKQTLDLMAKEKQHAELTAAYDARTKSGADDVAFVQRAVDGIFELQLAHIVAVTEQLRTDKQEANAAVTAKLRAALVKLEERAGTSYETLLAIRQAEHNGARPKPKRPRINPKKTPTQSTKQFLETKVAESTAQKLQAASANTDRTIDVEATPHEVLDVSMESVTSVDVTMACLMAVVEQKGDSVQADLCLLPRLEPLERLCACWGQPVPYCLQCKVGLAEAAAADAAKPPCTDEVCHNSFVLFCFVWLATLSVPVVASGTAAGTFRRVVEAP